MSLKGLRFTLEVDGLPAMTTAVVGFNLYQEHSTPFVLEVDIASGLPDLTATDFLEKNASGNDPAIARAAMKAEQLIPQFIDAPDSAQFQNLSDGQPLNSAQLDELRSKYPLWDIVSGVYIYQQLIVVYRRMTDAELDKAVQIETSYSQHSSIVANVEVSEKSTAYDLAIGQCEAFNHKAFWKQLLLQADWRRAENPDSDVRQYYQDGILPSGFKPFMNKPERQHAMPTGDLGVVNDYGGITQIKDPFSVPYGQPNIDISKIETETDLQWPMPEPEEI